MQAVLAALCSCTSVDVVDILLKKRQELKGLRVSAEGTQAPAPPRVFTHITLTYAVRGKLSRKAVEGIIPQVEDQSWFFDTELLVLAEKQGYRIKDIPVVWVEDDDTRVKIFQTGWEDIKGVFRVRQPL